MSKKTKVIYRKALYQIQGIPPSLWIGADKFSKTIHKDNCKKNNDITIKLIKFDDSSPIEKRTVCCDLNIGLTLNEYFEKAV